MTPTSRRALLSLATFGILLCEGMARPTDADEIVLLPRRSEWKFLVTPALPSAYWTKPAYDDSSWPTGAGILGYGENYIDTTIGWGPDSQDKYPTTYFRTEFDVVNPMQHLAFVLGARFDDGIVCYLNGHEILRRKLPSGPVAYDTFASSHEGGSYETHELPDALDHLVAGSNVLAVEVHQMSATSPDLVFDLEVVTQNVSANLARGPYLQTGAPTHATIRWRTDTPTDSRVTYGLSPTAMPFDVNDFTLTTEHEVIIASIAPDTRHYYTIGSTTNFVAGGDSTYYFRSSPIPATDRPVRVWVIGDSGEANQEARDVRDAYVAYTGSTETDVWLMLGDNAYGDGEDSEYQDAVFDMYPQLLRNTVVWPTRGNHDKLHSGPNNDYYDIFTLPSYAQAGGVISATEAYYSFDYANVHFICLDSHGSDRTLGSPMVMWLYQDLVATNQDWIIAYFHHPPYTKGSHDSDDPGDSDGRLFEIRENVVPILEAGGVDLVLSGHSHSYERSFLINGHHDVSSTLQPWMILDGGDGRIGGDGAYSKETAGPGAQEGAVYAVAGSSSKKSGGDLDHPVMYASLNMLGSLVLDIDGDQLDATFIDDTGTPQDTFTIRKNVATDAGVVGPEKDSRLELRPGHPNPFRGRTTMSYVVPKPGHVRVTVFDALGRRVCTLVDANRSAGEHTASWNGRNSRGKSVGPGVYFGVLVHEGEVRTRKLIRIR